MASPLLSEVSFGSYLVYSPRGTSDVSRQSQAVRARIKAGRDDTLERIAAHIQARFDASGLAAVLGPDVVLVPAPRSAPLVSGALWPARRIAEKLISAGLGLQVLPCLERVEAVPKSAFQQPGARPNAARHYETMRADAVLVSGSRITVVDDFITKGNTLLAAATRIAEAYPRQAVGVFALVRTLGLQPEVDELVRPCVGTIRLRGGEGVREP